MIKDPKHGPLADLHLQYWSACLIGFVITIALLTLAGWQWGIESLRRPIPGLVAMNPVTALSFLMIGVSFLLATGAQGLLPHSKPGRILNAGVFMIGLLRLGSAISPSLWRIDHIMYPGRLDLDQPGNVSNRMAFTTAICFILSAISLWLLRSGKGRSTAVSQYMALVTAFLSLFFIIGYIYQVKEYYSALKMIPMAIHTAVCFLLLSISLLFSQPGEGIMKGVTGLLTGSVMARRLIPFAVIVPVLLGFLRLFGHWYAIFSVEFGVAILVISIIFFFMILIWHNMLLLNQRDLVNKSVEMALRASEGQFRLLVGGVKGYAIFMVDQEGRVATWNEGAETIIGYSAREAIGLPMSTFYEKEEIEKGAPWYNLELAKEHNYFNYEGWRVRKDGTRFWADIVFTAIHDDQGFLKGFAKITRAMSENKRAREKIASQARLIEDTSDAIFSMDSILRIVSWNKAAEALYGISSGEAIGQPVGDVLKTSLSEDLRTAIRNELQATGYWKGEVTYTTKRRGPFTVSIAASGTRDDQGQLDGYLVTCRDITERIKKEAKLRKFNEELEDLVKEKTAELTSVFERVSDGFIAFDKMGQITYANKKAADMNRRSTDQLIGRNFWTEFPSAADNEFGENYQNSITQQKNIHFEMFSPSLQLWIECYMYPSPNGLSLFFRDITERIKAQEMLIRSNAELRDLASHLQNIREEERGAIAREIHDELGQQLTGMKMDLSWISQKAETLNYEQVRQKVKNSLDLLNNTIHTVRRIATTLRPSILDDLGLIAAIEWQSQDFEKRSGIRTIFRSGMPEMDFPPAMAIGLFRICQESLTNVARHADARTVRITLDNIADRIILTVADDGKGIDNEKSANKKTLGLLGMKERALMMGGVLSIANIEPGGLKLEVEVPMTFSKPQ